MHRLAMQYVFGTTTNQTFPIVKLCYGSSFNEQGFVLRVRSEKNPAPYRTHANNQTTVYVIFPFTLYVKPMISESPSS